MKLDQTKKEKIFLGFVFILRIVLGCMFIYSSLPKIRQPYDFLADVYNYELVGPKLGMLTAMMLPWAELLVGICLVGGIFIKGALLLSTGLGAIFSFVLGWALYKGLAISCGCFSTSIEGTVSYLTLIRALAIVLFSGLAYLVAVFLQSRKETIAM